MLLLQLLLSRALQQPGLEYVKLMAHAGHMVGLFRDPDQRILSGYHDEHNNSAAVNYIGHLDNIMATYFNGGLDEAKCTESLRNVPKVPLLEFAEGWKGGMTYQFQRQPQAYDASRRGGGSPQSKGRFCVCWHHRGLGFANLSVSQDAWGTLSSIRFQERQSQLAREISRSKLQHL